MHEHLYTPIASVADLKCANNQNQAVPCANGFCQLIRSKTSNVDRRCMPQGRSANPSGMMITSTTTEGSDNETNIIYVCNKPMCNGAETDVKVQELLKEYGLWNEATSSNSAMATFHWTMMNFQSVLFLTITILLKI